MVQAPVRLVLRLALLALSTAAAAAPPPLPAPADPKGCQGRPGERDAAMTAFLRDHYRRVKDPAWVPPGALGSRKDWPTMTPDERIKALYGAASREGCEGHDRLTALEHWTEALAAMTEGGPDAERAVCSWSDDDFKAVVAGWAEARAFPEAMARERPLGLELFRRRGVSDDKGGGRPERLRDRATAQAARWEGTRQLCAKSGPALARAAAGVDAALARAGGAAGDAGKTFDGSFSTQAGVEGALAGISFSGVTPEAAFGGALRGGRMSAAQSAELGRRNARAQEHFKQALGRIERSAEGRRVLADLGAFLAAEGVPLRVEFARLDPGTRGDAQMEVLTDPQGARHVRLRLSAETLATGERERNPALAMAPTLLHEMRHIADIGLNRLEPKGAGLLPLQFIEDRAFLAQGRFVVETEGERRAALAALPPRLSGVLSGSEGFQGMLANDVRDPLEYAPLFHSDIQRRGAYLWSAAFEELDAAADPGAALRDRLSFAGRAILEDAAWESCGFKGATDRFVSFQPGGLDMNFGSAGEAVLKEVTARVKAEREAWRRSVGMAGDPCDAPGLRGDFLRRVRAGMKDDGSGDRLVAAFLAATESTPGAREWTASLARTRAWWAAPASASSRSALEAERTGYWKGLEDLRRRLPP